MAIVKGPLGSLATPVAQDGSPGASTVAMVTPRPVLDMAELARAQESSQEMQELHAKRATQDVLMSRHKIWSAISMRCLVFKSVHSLAHLCISVTRRMLTSRFVLNSCSSDVNTWCQECQ